MSRIPLSTDLKTRTGAPDKDARLKNCYVEVRGDQSAVRRRASCQSDGDVIVAGTAQGGIGLTINGTDLVVTVNGDYIVMGSGSIGGGGGGYIGTQPVNLADPDVSDIDWMLLIPYCDEADILASYPTDDKGTSVFAGPAETAYTVPQTTATRTIHGETPCGQLLIKTVTKTYSARSEANQWKTVSSGVLSYSYSGYTDTPLSGTIGYPSIGYGNTVQSSTIESYKLVHAAAPSSFGHNVPYQEYVATKTAYGDPNSNVIYYSGTPGGTVQVYQFMDNSDSQLTLYYLDVHEVWTYSVI